MGSDNILLISAVGVAIMGGVASWLTSERLSIVNFFISTFLAGFVGLLVGQLCILYNMADAWTFFLCGSAGVGAETLIKIFRKIAVDKLQWFLGAGPTFKP